MALDGLALTNLRCILGVNGALGCSLEDRACKTRQNKVFWICSVDDASCVFDHLYLTSNRGSKCQAFGHGVDNTKFGFDDARLGVDDAAFVTTNGFRGNNRFWPIKEGVSPQFEGILFWGLFGSFVEILEATEIQELKMISNNNMSG